MTIKLARIAERNGLVFLVDSEGKELPNVCLAPQSAIEWMCQSPGTAKQQIDRWAAEVDVSAALVKVPERRIFDANDLEGWKHEVRGFNQCLDALERK